VAVGDPVVVGVIVFVEGVGVVWMFCGVQFESETLKIDGSFGDSNRTPSSG
jgi:hypothetical protein